MAPIFLQMERGFVIYQKKAHLFLRKRWIHLITENIFNKFKCQGKTVLFIQNTGSNRYRDWKRLALRTTENVHEQFLRSEDPSLTTKNPFWKNIGITELWYTTISEISQEKSVCAAQYTQSNVYSIHVWYPIILDDTRRQKFTFSYDGTRFSKNADPTYCTIYRCSTFESWQAHMMLKGFPTVVLQSFHVCITFASPPTSKLEIHVKQGAV